MKKRQARPGDRRKLIEEFKATRDKLMKETASCISLLKANERKLKGDK